MPVSLCKWTSISQPTTPLKVLINSYTCLGFAQPTVSAIPTLFTPILSTVWYIDNKSTKSDRNESSEEKRTSMPLDLTKLITSIAVLVMYVMSFPCENSRRKEEVPITTSTPSTPGHKFYYEKDSRYNDSPTCLDSNPGIIYMASNVG